MEKIVFKNGSPPYISEKNLNQMQENIEKAIDETVYTNTKKLRLKIMEDTENGALITIPLNYKVGANTLDVYINGEKILLCTTYDDETTGHYSEVGEIDSISNQIKLTSDWNLEVGDILQFIVRGEWNSDTAE